jgi:predicted metal-dependent hydrolase
MNEFFKDIDGKVEETIPFTNIRIELPEELRARELELDSKQIKLIQSIISRFKTRSSVKELILDEVKYAQEEKDSVRLYLREWEFTLERLNEKAQMKGTRNKEGILDLADVIEKFIRVEKKKKF